MLSALSMRFNSGFRHLRTEVEAAREDLGPKKKRTEEIRELNRGEEVRSGERSGREEGIAAHRGTNRCCVDDDQCQIGLISHFHSSECSQ